ncbi:UDP-N-acetylmuramate--L-alanine ligase, partial [Patescibacteria group bacterium]|nr:UDP-N-acetylmuramate--L-alanine ligase [Patescibacteria group bacterium]
NLKNILSAFRKLVKKVPTHGVLVAGVDDENIRKVIKSAKCKVITFGLKKGNFLATHIIRHGELTRFAIKGPEAFDSALRVPGVHNALNALASTIMALALGIRQETIQKALLKYRGVWRRFEVKGEQKGITVVDDYAHHPTEIKATLITARQYFLDKRIWCVFQPHQRNRTKQLFKDFVQAFSNCDKLILTEIYDVAGREHGEKINSLDLVKAIKKLKKEVIFIKDLKDVTPYLIKNAKSDDVIITMGAGDITKVSDELIKKLK